MSCFLFKKLFLRLSCGDNFVEAGRRIRFPAILLLKKCNTKIQRMKKQLLLFAAMLLSAVTVLAQNVSISREFDT